MMDLSKALAWIKQNVQPYLPLTRITCVTVGNEVLSGNDTALMANLLPAMQSVYQSLVALGIDEQVSVTTAHSFAILANSFPPSSGSFRHDLYHYLQPLLNFHSQTKSPFLINAYPFFAYKADPDRVPLQYALFEPNPGVTDPITNLKYDNMLYAQMDAAYSAIRAMGHTDIDIRISETGWPSMGDPEEEGATPENAAAYNGNLLKRIAMNQGTPLKPSVPIDVHVFALFNEDMKPGPTSERNYGLFYPDGSPVYNIGLHGSSLPSSYSYFSSSSQRTVCPNLPSFFLLLLLLVLLSLNWFFRPAGEDDTRSGSCVALALAGSSLRSVRIQHQQLFGELLRPGRRSREKEGGV
ncbi:unnamed protein product [Spirodela intermedia]|uniref:glucan endo-1,3-beta-D-glucosidase n=1 Tax=Spirodela intermedia TaxID=51605 RepID=A0A7I8L5R5_SPIIN|nr:unnamed protein product [Spirodela intermedia]